MRARLLLNGKKASQEDIREAVYKLRAEGYELEVRPTWEAGDFERLVLDAAQQKVTRIIAGGGDGTVNEIVDTFLRHNITSIELAVLPLGTANDFASACEIPTNDAYQALSLAVTGHSYLVDAASVNERYFINIATAGFGAQVTANTPVALKNFLGGGAYTLSGLVQALNFLPFQGTVKLDGKTRESNVVVGAICNGRMAGGGQLLAPEAYIDDGLLDAVSLESFMPSDMATVIEELQQKNISSGNFVYREQVKQVEWISESIMPVNLDGEPITSTQITISVLPQAVALVLPDRCPVLKNAIRATIL
ncbi:lipid kinase YegS [Shewanella maritima]|uniref:lipid kinase YegS n=1 Tax=Shewanella maritima TaxID=2520507 RepID=UPI0037350D9A